MAELIAIGAMATAAAVLAGLLGTAHRRAKEAERDLRWVRTNYESEKLISEDYRKRYRLAENEVARLAGVISQNDSDRTALLDRLDTTRAELADVKKRNADQDKWRSEHEDAFDQIFAIAQKHARPF